MKDNENSKNENSRDDIRTIRMIFLENEDNKNKKNENSLDDDCQ